MRGERGLREDVLVGAVGSSPHARGTLDSINACKTMHRFIPACAGNATGCPGSRCCSAVHPRMRGERCISSPITTSVSGSSPHARGTPGVSITKALAVRFIPACAGNATGSGPTTSQGTVHPRMRGERLTKWYASPPKRGSSPHARGTRFSDSRLIVMWRFIPACAGNAYPRSV